MARKIRQNDTVVVIAGKDRGKTGRVLRVVEDGKRVVVEKANIVKRHSKPTAEHQQGGIIDREAPLHISNVMLVDARTGEAFKPKFRVEGGSGGKKTRYNPKTGEDVE